MSKTIEKRKKFVPAKIRCMILNKRKHLIINLIPRSVRVWTVRDIRSDAMAITDSRIDYNGLCPKRFTTTCYLKPRIVPVWYTESLEIKINSSKRVFRETVYFKPKLEPHYWSEHMVTDIDQKKSTYTKTVTPHFASSSSLHQSHSIPIEAN